MGRYQHASREMDTEEKSSKRRPICEGCGLPAKTCICQSLPAEPLSGLLTKSRLVVLQHPHESRKKNRSLPLVELCLFGKRTGKGAPGPTGKKKAEDEKSASAERNEAGDFVMKTLVGRRFGDNCDADVLRALRDPEEVTVLVFPHEQALGLDAGLKLAEERRRAREEGTGRTAKINLVFIDATWKLANEMYRKVSSLGEWPDDLIRVQMKPSEAGATSIPRGASRGGDAEADGEGFKTRRFMIRAPPSPDHLSTAECLAWVTSMVEDDPRIYQGIMTTLDYQVDIWRSFSEGKGKKRDGRTGDEALKEGEFASMSQKQRRIK